MQAVWILLGKTRFPCTFLQSSLEQGVQEVDIPFELSAEYLLAAVKINNDQLEKLSDYNVPVDAAFDHIVTNHPRMLKLKAQAQILAEREVPVLISGETDRQNFRLYKLLYPEFIIIHIEYKTCGSLYFQSTVCIVFNYPSSNTCIDCAREVLMPR
ncbi:hypothetical protein MTsDn1_00140 [Alteromonas sp. MTD1]|jgi:hypothetical protein|uniref:hypothetical protein n=1 Tax=Alteromonas sp. MTD1 TaxID=3057962 RepID=UPI0036F2C732